jgi:hypothetical protein
VPPSSGLGGWGNGLPISLSDLLLVRRAIREGWSVSPAVRDAVVSDVTFVALSEDEACPRRFLSAVHVFIAMEAVNQAIDIAEHRRKYGIPRRARRQTRR